MAGCSDTRLLRFRISWGSSGCCSHGRAVNTNAAALLGTGQVAHSGVTGCRRGTLPHPLPAYLCCRAPRCPRGWGRSRLRRPGRQPPPQPPLPSACSSWPRWLSASARACGPCSGLLPGSGEGETGTAASVLQPDRRPDTGRMGEGVSPGLWLLGHVSSAATSPGDFHPQGHLRGGIFGWV